MALGAQRRRFCDSQNYDGNLSDETLLNWLARDELIYKKLAMQEIMRRKDYQLQTLEKVFRQCQVDDCVHSLMYK